MARLVQYRDDEHEEAMRLRRAELMERDPQPEADSPLVAWVKTAPYQAAGLIEALQGDVRMMGVGWHIQRCGWEAGHAMPFRHCPHRDCSRLRDRLRAFQ